MNDFEKMIMKEISALNEMRLIEVLGFIRYLKMNKPPRQGWIEGWFEHALQSIHERQDELQITPEEVQAQVKKMREMGSPNG